MVSGNSVVFGGSAAFEVGIEAGADRRSRGDSCGELAGQVRPNADRGQEATGRTERMQVAGPQALRHIGPDPIGSRDNLSRRPVLPPGPGRPMRMPWGFRRPSKTPSADLEQHPSRPAFARMSVSSAHIQPAEAPPLPSLSQPPRIRICLWHTRCRMRLRKSRSSRAERSETTTETAATRRAAPTPEDEE